MSLSLNSLIPLIELQLRNTTVTKLTKTIWPYWQLCQLSCRIKGKRIVDNYLELSNTTQSSSAVSARLYVWSLKVNPMFSQCCFRWPEKNVPKETTTCTRSWLTTQLEQMRPQICYWMVQCNNLIRPTFAILGKHDKGYDARFTQLLFKMFWHVYRYKLWSVCYLGHLL